MAEFADREHFIPLMMTEIVDLLCANDEAVEGSKWDDDTKKQFRCLCRHIEEHFHQSYYRRFRTLKDAYAPFDPDVDTVPLATPSQEERQKRLDRLFMDFDWLMERANFRKVSRQEIEAATAVVSHWGLNMNVDFSVFERLEIYYRGDAVGQRTLRRVRNWYRRETVTVPTFQRLVLILKQRAHKRLGAGADTRNVFLKLFKDIPKMDVEMMLPGAEIRMPKLKRGTLGVSMLSTLGFIGWKIATEINHILISNPLSYYGLLSLVFGYGYRQWAGFQSVRRSYSLQLTQSLYYQNLDNNAGVFHRLLDAAEEQECREAALAYFFLWRFAGNEGWTAESLDDRVEDYLEQKANIKADFEIGDALNKLVKLNCVEQTGGVYRALPIEKAMQAVTTFHIDD